MKSELKKLKEEFPDLDHVERSVCRLSSSLTLTDSCCIDGLLRRSPPSRFKMGAANWHKKKEEREAAKTKD